MKVNRFLQALGIAAIVLYPLYGAFLSSPEFFRTHNPTSLARFAWALIVNLALVAAITSALRSWVFRTHFGSWIRLLIPALLTASFVEGIYIYLRGTPWFAMWVVVFIAGAGFMLLLHAAWNRGTHIALRVSGLALAGLGLFGLIVVFQLIRLAFWQPLPNLTTAPVTGENSAASHPRIVWIVFDELSYNEAFEHRPSDLRMPNFDDLRQSSTLFTNVQPVAKFTTQAIPSMLLGRTIQDVHYSEDSHFLVAGPGEKLQTLDAKKTPFALARKHGLTTSVLGWYLPYCGMLAPFLNQCYWTNDWLEPSVFIIGDGFWRNLADAWVRYGMALHLIGHKRELAYRIRVLQDLTGRAEEQLTQSQPDFIFIHLPVPHPPGIYDRTTMQFDISGKRSYIDNLALADRTLGELMAALHSSPAWPNTSIVICGDHSWRTWLWRTLPGWTPTDEKISHNGAFDPRPVLIVHYAGQNKSLTVDRPFSLIRVHDILESLILGEYPNFQ